MPTRGLIVRTSVTCGWGGFAFFRVFFRVERRFEPLEEPRGARVEVVLEREWDGVMAHDLHDVDGIRAAGQAPGLERAAQVVETKVLDLGPLTRGLEAGADVFVGPKNSSFGWSSFRVRPKWSESSL